MSLAAPEAAATPCGTNIGTSEIAIDLGSGSVARLRIYDRNGTPAAPTTIFGVANTSNQTTVMLRDRVAGCDYFVGFPPGGRQDAPSKYILFEQDVAFPVTVEIERLLFRPGAAPGAAPETEGIDRFVYNAGSADPQASFFNPDGEANHDVYFKVETNRTRVSPDPFWNYRNGAGIFIDEAIPDDGWVFPYHRDAICAVVAACASSAQSDGGESASPQASGVPFVMPIDGVFVYGQPLVKTLTPALSMTFSPLRTVNWVEGWLTLAFAPGTGLGTASPDFRVSNVRLTASDETQGWRGIGVSGGTATFTDVRTTGISYDDGSYYKRANSAIRVSGGATLTLRGGSELSGTRAANGIEAVGATVIIEGVNTRIFDNAYAGVVAMPGARVTIRDRAQVTGNGAGIFASGYDARISLDRARISGNVGTGVSAVGGGYVATTSAGTLGLRTEVIENHGGLDGDSGGSVFMGTCNQSGVSRNAGHGIIRNATPPGAQTVYFDARATGGSLVRAEDNDWAVANSSALVLQADASSPLLVSPLRQAANASACYYIPTSSGKAGSPGAPQTSASLGGVESALAAVVEAEEALSEGDETGATALIAAAFDAAETDDERAGVYGGATRILAQTQPVGLVADIAARASGPGRPYALRALAVAAASAGDAATADDYAAALVAEYGGTSHEAGALAIRTRLSAAGGDEAGALAHLGALYALAPTSTSFASSAAVVVAAFPDADLDWISEDLSAGKQGSGVASTVAATDARLAVWPNPTTGAARVSVPTASGETLSMSVYDGLGRRVAVLADGATATGGTFEAALPAGTLPPGIYLVRMERRGVDGQTSAAVARLTVVR